MRMPVVHICASVHTPASSTIHVSLEWVISYLPFLLCNCQGWGMLHRGSFSMSLVFLLKMCQLISSVRWGVYCTRHLLMESGGSMNVMFPTWYGLQLFGVLIIFFLCFLSICLISFRVGDHWLKSNCVFLTNVAGFYCLYFTVWFHCSYRILPSPCHDSILLLTDLLISYIFQFCSWLPALHCSWC